jgi:hypothetical protein
MSTIRIKTPTGVVRIEKIETGPNVAVIVVAETEGNLDIAATTLTRDNARALRDALNRALNNPAKEA